MSYHLFGGHEYYPTGGWFDHLGAFDTIAEAEAAASQDGYPAQWAHIVHDGEIIRLARYDWDVLPTWEDYPPVSHASHNP